MTYPLVYLLNIPLFYAYDDIQASYRYY